MRIPRPNLLNLLIKRITDEQVLLLRGTSKNGWKMQKLAAGAMLCRTAVHMSTVDDMRHLPRGSGDLSLEGLDLGAFRISIRESKNRRDHSV